MRKLCTIQHISAIENIPNADSIEVVVIKGWKVVTKKDEFKVGDLVAYFEIDSLIKKTSVTEFLFKGCESKQAVRLRTVKLRGQVSQGLVISLDSVKQMAEELNGGLPCDFVMLEGLDLSDILQVEKWEPPVKMTSLGRYIEWPFSISQTDEERIQNIPEIIDELRGVPLCASIKLDGTSMTVIYKKDRVHVAGRTGDFDPTDEVAYNNSYWKTALKYNLPDILSKASTDKIHYAVQGELVGPGILKNRLGLKEHDFYIFNLLVSKDGGCSWERQGLCDLLLFCEKYGLKVVPYYLTEFVFDENTSLDSLQKMVDRKYVEYFPTADPKQNIEGMVFRTIDHQTSFKVVSNKYLLEGGD